MWMGGWVCVVWMFVGLCVSAWVGFVCAIGIYVGVVVCRHVRTVLVCPFPVDAP